MNIARFSVQRPVVVTMRIAALVLLGLVCLRMLQVDLLPNVTIPIVAVITQWPNVSPEEIEAQITRPIEEAVSGAPNMYEVSSSSEQGSSVVTVQFRWGTDIGRAAVDVLQLVERARQQFPTDPTLQAPIVFKYDPSQLPILIFGVSGINNPVKLRTLLDNEVTPILESADGVAAAVATGGDQRAIIVDVHPNRLRAYHLTLNDVINRIEQENINLPAGIAKQSKTEYTIRSLGWFTSPQQIAEVPVTSSNGRVVPLSAVATVKDNHQETRIYTRLNGQPAAGIIITKQNNANTVATTQSVFDKLKEVRRLFPELKFKVAYDQATAVTQSINSVRDAALLGGILAVLILLFFLRNFQSTLVVALSIPISIISTFTLIYLCGYTLNTMSLGGLALATGLIVDDAVVVLENIFRHIERDKKPAPEAAVSGTNEIMSAVLASTFTVSIVFLPLFLIQGQAGMMFAQFAIVVVFAMAVSLLDATTVVPMLASRLIRGEAHHQMMAADEHSSLSDRLFARFGRWFDALDQAYQRRLKWSLRHRIWVILGAIVITVASFLLIPYIGTELMPQTDTGDFTLTVKLPPGTALSVTNRTMKKIEAMLLKNPNVGTVFSSSGTTLNLRGASTNLVPYEGSAMVQLKANRKQSTQQVINQIERQASQLPGVRVFAFQYDLVSLILTGGFQNVEVDIFGSSLKKLAQIGQQVAARLRTIAGYTNVDTNWQQATPEIQWIENRRKALQVGVTFSDIADTVNTATNGTIASYYQKGGFQYPIVVQLPRKDRKTVSTMENLMISPSMSPYPSDQGSPPQILLRQVAYPVYGMGPSEITRMNRQRYIAVTGTPAGGRSEGQIMAAIQVAMSKIHLPAGYYWNWGLTQQRQKQEFSNMSLALWLAIGLIYMLLASQFESFIHPLTILLSVPLSAVGVILALFLSGLAFGLTAFVGLLMLIGIVVKNGILLVDYTNQLRHRGLSRDEAVLRAAPTRLRPILMTASAATLGMLPIALGIGRGSEVQQPMATAVIGGLLTSTVLTLFIVPVVYTLFDDLYLSFQQRKSERERKLEARSDMELDARDIAKPIPADTPEPVD